MAHYGPKPLDLPRLSANNADLRRPSRGIGSYLSPSRKRLRPLFARLEGAQPRLGLILEIPELTHDPRRFGPDSTFEGFAPPTGALAAVRLASAATAQPGSAGPRVKDAS